MDQAGEEFRMSPGTISYTDHRLCYNGQKCHRIPEALVKIYGPQVHSLDFSFNELVTLKGIEHFPLLKELVLDNNELSDSIIVPYLPHLHTLSLNKNKIADLEGLLEKISHNLPVLSYLSLLANKACPNQLSNNENDDDDYQRYRYFVIHRLPKLQFLDSSEVKPFERAEAKRRGDYSRTVRPTDTAATEPHPSANNLTPLPCSVRNATDFKSSYGKCKYRYNGKHSEGNRFICNNDL